MRKCDQSQNNDKYWSINVTFRLKTTGENCMIKIYKM